MTPIHPGIWRLKHGRPEAITPLSLREIPPRADALAAMPAATAPFALADARWEIDDRGCRLRLPLADDEEFYGLGLQLKSVAQREKKKTLRVNSDPVADTGDSHAPVPFLASTRGWALLIDTARYATFYVGSHRRARDLAEPAQGGAGGTTDELYQVRSGGTRELVVELPGAQGASVILFGGPTLLDAVRRHVLFSGGGCMPPLWGLGVWYRAWGKATRADVERIAAQIRADHIPCDVLGLEPGWQTAAYPCSYRWDDGRFPDHRAFLDRLHADGFRVNCWEHAFVHPSAACYGAILPHAGESAVFDGLVPDFTVPEVRAAFAAVHTTLVDEGIDGFKLDECDGSDFIRRPWSFPEHDRFPGSGLDGERMHSLFGMLYLRTVHALYAQRGRRSYHEVRNAGALAAPYPFVLYSDLYDHRDFLRGVPSSGTSGLLWCPEVRQCASVEDLARRVQSTALSAQCLINAWMLPQPPWVQINRERNIAGEEMPERARATALVREAFRLRMSLVPWLYAAFRRYRDDGTPPFRALALDYPDDPACRACDDQWLIGDGLLCAPLTAAQSERQVVLPPGRWFALDGTPYVGGCTITVAAALDEVPLFVRDGTILPLAEPVERIAADTVFRLDVRVYGADPRPTDLWEDDGESDAWERGAGNRLRLAWDGGGSAERRGAWDGRRYDISRWTRLGV